MKIPLHHSRFAFLLLVCAVLAAPLAPAAEVANCSLVPGWRQDGALRHFTADNLYEYMDGNAESYLAYGFTQMQGVTCKSGENTLVIDISEMVDADAAYGIFSANRDPGHPLEKIGMGGQIMPRRGTFAKGNYYVEISATPDLDHTPALTAFIAAMEKLLEGTQHATGGTRLVSAGKAGECPPDSGKRPGRSPAQARLRGAVRPGQGFSGARNLTPVRRGRS